MLKTRKTTLIAILVVLAATPFLIQLVTAPTPTIVEQEPSERAAQSGNSRRSMADEPVFSQSEVSFDDGLFATVEWRDRWEENQDEYPQTYAELRELAEQGDPAATRRLVGLLTSCKHAALPPSDAELEEIVAQMRTSYSLPVLTDGRFEFHPDATGDLANFFESGEELTAFIDQWQAITGTCTRVSMDQRGEADYWLSVLQAQDPNTDYSKRRPKNMNRDETIAYLEGVWATGDPRALGELASIYTGSDAESSDPLAYVRSFAATYVWFRAAIESARYHGETERLSELQRGLSIVIRNHEELLREREIADAYRLARELVENNDNCCIRLRPTRN